MALPILTPSILGTMILLFGNAFGAQATAYQLTGGALPLLTLVISSQISGDVLHNLGWLRRRDDDDRDHGRVDWSLHGAPAPLRTVVAFMTSGGTPPPLGPMGVMRSWLRAPRSDVGPQTSLATRILSQ